MSDVEDRLIVRMEATLTRFENQMKRATKVAGDTATGVENRFKRMNDTISQSADRAATGLSRVTNISSAGRFVLQNTAAQLGDIAVQMEMGTNPSRVMAQQLPQLLGGFGALGGALGIVAPLLGTVAAVGIPVAAMLWDVGEEADKSKEKVQTFADKLEAANAALTRAQQAASDAGEGSLKTLRERYGEVTRSVIELADALADIEKRAAMLKVEEVLDDAFGKEFAQQIDKLFGTVGEAFVGNFKEGIPEQKALIAELERDIAAIRLGGMVPPQSELDRLATMREELAAMQGDAAGAGRLMQEIKFDPALLQQISQLKRDLDDALKARDIGEIARLANEIRAAFAATGQEIDQGMLDKLVQAEDFVRRTDAGLRSAGQAADGVASAAGNVTTSLSNAVGEAAALAANLRDAMSALSSIAAGINSLSLDNIGKRARVAALQAGRSAAQASIEGRMAQEAEKLKPLISSSNEVLRNQGLAKLREIEAELQEGAGLDALLEQFSRKRSGGRKGGAGRGKKEARAWDVSEGEIEALQLRIDMIGRTSSEIARMQAEQRLLNEAKRRGLDLDAVQVGTGETLRQQISRQADEIGNLTQQYEQAQERARFFDQAQGRLKEGILDAIVEGKNLSGVLQDLAKSFAKAALEAALFGSGPFSQGGGGGGLLGGFLRGILPGRAGGGPVTAGRPYMVGENGPEPFIPAVNGRILSNSEAHNALSAGRHNSGGSGSSIIHLQLSPDLTANILRQSGHQAIHISHAVSAHGLRENNRALPSQISALTARRD